jgi:hypothetical protein
MPVNNVSVIPGPMGRHSSFQEPGTLALFLGRLATLLRSLMPRLPGVHRMMDVEAVHSTDLGCTRLNPGLDSRRRPGS